jgi:hypothetical protein
MLLDVRLGVVLHTTQSVGLLLKMEVCALGCVGDWCIYGKKKWSDGVCLIGQMK